MKLTKKQTQALDFLEDDETEELLFGGGAGGGKSALGCYWQLKRRVRFPGSRGLIGRSKLKTLKETTLKTFFEIADKQKLIRGVHYDLTGSHDKENPNCITFWNGSLIYLRDLFLYPSDPDFDSLGSLEITDAFIDECNQVAEKGKDVVRSRIRFKLDNYCHMCGSQDVKQVIIHDTVTDKKEKWVCGNGHTTEGLRPKTLMTCNPGRNWTYSMFYKLWKEKVLPKGRQFIQSLVTDNPYISKHYIATLLTLGRQMVQRLYYGNWEYNDDPLLLFGDYDKILEVFTNDIVEPTGTLYITADIAYQGSDKFVVGVWDGWVITKIYAFDKKDETMVSKEINDIRILHKVPIGNTLYDADGLKKYVKQSAITGFLKGAVQFFNNSTPIGKENYYNLKTQCYFMLAEKVAKNEVWCKDQTYRDNMIQEFEQIRQRDREDDTDKIRLESKKDLKERLGRSPDFLDMMMMRARFDLRQAKSHTTSKETLKSINY